MSEGVLQALFNIDPRRVPATGASLFYGSPLRRTVYIETFNNNISIHMINAQVLKIYMPLSRFSENLPPYFLQCHKSFMVNMNHITSYEPHKFTLFTGGTVPIPVKKYKYVIQKYTDYINNI